MNAREAMQALLDGKEIVDNYDRRWKLNAEETLVSEDDVNPSGVFINNIKEIVEEYPLNFKQALHAMLEGKVAMCEVFNDRKYYFSDGWFQFQYHDDEWTQADWFEMRVRDAKWKVVE